MSDGTDEGAAVTVDGRLVAVVPQADVGPATDDLPWEAAEAALSLAGVQGQTIDAVVLVGKSTPVFLRTRPYLRRLMRAPFSPTLDAAVIGQALLRGSGIGAFSGDVTAEWLEGRARERGWSVRQAITVDVHWALAEAAYRLQPEDEALILVLHPRGDGSALSVHVGRLGQLDRVFQQQGFEALHVHLARATAALGLREHDLGRLGALAAQGRPDATAERLLAEHLYAEGPRLSRRSHLRPARLSDPVYAHLRSLPPADAAASVLENLFVTVEEVARYHLREQGLRHLCVAGSVFEEPRLAGRLAEMSEVDRVTVLPNPGRALLATAGAVGRTGMAPSWVNLRLGVPPSADAVADAVRAARLPEGAAEGWVERLLRGEALVRWRGRPGPDRVGSGERCVLVRPDDAVALATARRALGLPVTEPVVILVREGATLSWRRPSSGGVSAWWGSLAVELPASSPVMACAGADGRAVVQVIREGDSPALYRMLGLWERATGVGALAALPLVEADGPVLHDPAHVVQLWRRGGFGVLQLGDVAVERPA